MNLLLDNPHDLLFRATLSDPQRAGAILRAHLQPAIADLLADESPVMIDGTFVDEKLRASHSDKLMRVTLRDGRPAFVCALLQHKSRPDPGTALQVWKYKVRIWEDYARNCAERLQALPPIVPLVFYHGSEPWTAPGSIREMIAGGPDLLRDLEPTSGYFLRDPGRIPAEQLAADLAARAGLLTLRHSHHRGAMEERLRMLPHLLADLPDGTEFERHVVAYLITVWTVPVPALQAAAEQAKPGRGRTLVDEVVQELIDEVFKIGRDQGIAEGEACDEARTLTWLLEHRFGELSRTVGRRIEYASPAELDQWFKAALDAWSLPEVFGDLSPGPDFCPPD